MKSALNRVLSPGMNSRVWCLTMAVTLAGVSPAVAQVMVPDIGGRVFGIVGGSFGDGGSTIMTSGGVGLRLTRHLGLDLADDRLFFISTEAFATDPDRLARFHLFTELEYLVPLEE